VYTVKKPCRNVPNSDVDNGGAEPKDLGVGIFRPPCRLVRATDVHIGISRSFFYCERFAAAQKFNIIKKQTVYKFFSRRGKNCIQLRILDSTNSDHSSFCRSQSWRIRRPRRKSIAALIGREKSLGPTIVRNLVRPTT
jgi:hypothetical protein